MGLALDAAFVELTLATQVGERAWLCEVVRRPRAGSVGGGPVVGLRALGHKAPPEPALQPGAAAVLLYRSAGTLWRQPCVVQDAHGFPELRARIEGAPEAVKREPLVEVPATFPVNFQEVIPQNSEALCRHFRDRLHAGGGWGIESKLAGGSSAMLENQSEIAILALAKAMVRLDARFDRLQEALAKSSRRVIPTGRPERESSSPQEVLVFSLAKMMVTMLDEKFERLLAALRDPTVLARWSKKGAEEAGESAQTVPHDVLVIQALSRLMDSMSEKFERIVRLLSGRGIGGIALERAWAEAVGGDMLTVRLARPLAVEGTLDLELKLPLFPPLPLLAFGRVLDCEEIAPEEPEVRYRARVELAGLDCEDREILIQFVFRKQRELLRARRELKSRQTH